MSKVYHGNRQHRTATTSNLTPSMVVHRTLPVNDYPSMCEVFALNVLKNKIKLYEKKTEKKDKIYVRWHEIESFTVSDSITVGKLISLTYRSFIHSNCVKCAAAVYLLRLQIVSRQNSWMINKIKQITLFTLTCGRSELGAQALIAVSQWYFNIAQFWSVECVRLRLN